MHTGDLCFFTGASLFIVGVVGYFFTGPNNKGVYLLSSFVFFVVNVISVCMLPDNFLFLCGAVAYFHERRSLNNFHRDRVITFEQIAE